MLYLRTTLLNNLHCIPQNKPNYVINVILIFIYSITSAVVAHVLKYKIPQVVMDLEYTDMLYDLGQLFCPKIPPPPLEKFNNILEESMR